VKHGNRKNGHQRKPRVRTLEENENLHIQDWFRGGYRKLRIFPSERQRPTVTVLRPSPSKHALAVSTKTHVAPASAGKARQTRDQGACVSDSAGTPTARLIPKAFRKRARHRKRLPCTAPTHVDNGAVTPRPSVVILPPVPRGAPDHAVSDRDAADGGAAGAGAGWVFSEGAHGGLRCAHETHEHAFLRRSW